MATRIVHAHAIKTANIPFEDGNSARATASRLSHWLKLAAAPTFAVMAALTGLSGDDPMSQVCSMGTGTLLSGMLPMYILMSAFHAPPWLTLIIARREHNRLSRLSNSRAETRREPYHE